MPVSSAKRRGLQRRSLRRLGVLFSSLALTAGLVPAVAAPAEAAGYRSAGDGAKVVHTYRYRNLMDVSIQSPALGSTQKVRLILPKSWKANSKRTWPVVYAYHGGANNYQSWTKNGHLQSLASQWDVMVVMPEGASGSYADWYNYGNGGTPKWETWHTQEVVQIMERNFHAGGSRAAIGLSSGGQGAITYAFRHPGMFKSASSYSGLLSLYPPFIRSLLIYTDWNTTPDPFRIWGIPGINEANWSAHDPSLNVARLRATPRIYISSGHGSANFADIAQIAEYACGRSADVFVQAAQKAGVPLTTHLYGGGAHSWGYWIREVHSDWPGVMKAIGAHRA